jgi:hypothetical protein
VDVDEQPISGRNRRRHAPPGGLIAHETPRQGPGRSASLSALEEALLRRWGYPYVMEAFRFHMTLTARLQQDERDRLLPPLRQMFGAVTNASFTLDAVSLCYQEARNLPFRLIRRYPFAAVSARSIATKEAIDRVSGPSLTSVRTSSPST